MNRTDTINILSSFHEEREALCHKQRQFTESVQSLPDSALSVCCFCASFCAIALVAEAVSSTKSVSNSAASS